jgi:ubiquinone/menaquinone biosynthesis C-methylase UbiE
VWESGLLSHVQTFSYNEEEFDLVLCASPFTHLLPHETDNYIGEIGRVLKPKGRCVLTAFILNGDTSPTADQGIIKFPVQCEGYRVANSENTSWAVALPEPLLRGMLEKRGLRICEITYGFWAGGTDLLCALQDCVLAVKKPRAETYTNSRRP